MGQEAMKQHGVFSWNELVTNDKEAAKAFYGELFGWVLQDMDNSPVDYTMAKVGDQEVAGFMSLPAGAPKGMPPTWGGYVTVDDVDASTVRAESLGGKVIMPAQNIPDVGRFCIIQDPQGAMLSLITYNG